MNNHRNSLNILRWTVSITLAAWAGAVYQGYVLARELQVSWGSVRWMMALIVGGIGLLILTILLALTGSPWRGRLLNGITRGGRLLARLRFLHLPLMILVAGIFPLILLPSYPEPVGSLLRTFFWRAFPLWLATVAGAAILHTRLPEQGWWFAVGISALVYGVAYRIAVFLPDISTYPFTLYWSEASRYYYASLFFSDQVYGVHANPTVLHPTRYLMQSVPFLISGLPIWVHRLWQVILWVVTNAIAAGLVVWRIKKPGLENTSFFEKIGSWTPWLIGLWAFLFLFQGPIWYHLVMMMMIVLWGTDTSRFWKTLIVVLVASAWGGISRVNWIPFPAALAGMIYLLEREKGELPLLGYLLPPVVWGIVGGIAGLLAQTGYMQWSGNISEQFGSAFTSDLLWYRLFPSATYPLGVLPGIALVSLPVIWLGMGQLQRQWGATRPGQAIHPIRWLGIGGVIGVFFAGGLVVSAKIGGGSNLHNMDGYLALFLVAGAYTIFGKVKLEPVAMENDIQSRSKLTWLVVVL
ncbi:MAG TPA: hypothetical protein VI451_09725, partial [Anaerolineales bacterium]|nr:hypothetical protein [Anaerolineales bacterium]